MSTEIKYPTESPKLAFVNPWADSAAYRYITTTRRGVMEKARGESGFTQRTEVHDLYALVCDAPHSQNNMISVSFGARYGNEPHEYISGEAFYTPEKGWAIMGGREIQTAAALFFANFHPWHSLIPMPEQNNPITGENK